MAANGARANVEASQDPSLPSTQLNLDGPGWRLATDPNNVGRDERWFQATRAEAKPTKVPWIIQDAFPGYHGVAWYWRAFVPPAQPQPQGRYLLRFWAVDYKADVWLNGIKLGEHEGGEEPFLLDATAALDPGQTNLLAVRVLNPTHTPLDGIVLNETPHRNKALPYGSGSAWNQGGIMDSVEVLAVPAVRVADLFVRPDWKTGIVQIRVAVANATPNTIRGALVLSIAPAASGETLASTRSEREFGPGDGVLATQLTIQNPHLWDLNDPFLYRVTASLSTESPASRDEYSTRCGFRDFRFEKGSFQLNGRRIYLRSSHTGNCTPIGLELPHDPDLLRRDLVNAKMTRFNCIRFIAGVPKRYQLDLCDEIGLMVYEESYAGWCLADSPQMAARYDASVLGMVRRDRNHPSVVIWGLLNETPEGPVFRQAVKLLPKLRTLDESRLVLINSGRWDSQGGSLTGIENWREGDRPDPCVNRNSSGHVVRALGITWQPGQLAFHPGQHGEYAVVRWTAPASEQVELNVLFQTIAERATTDIHVLHNGRALFDSFIHVQGCGPRTNFSARLPVQAADTLDCALGFGNGHYGADTTALACTVKTDGGQTHDAAADFSTRQNPNGVWSYGQLAPGPKPEVGTFTRFRTGIRHESVGTLSNPGSTVWEDVLADTHPYQRVPHTADIIHTLRTLGEGGQPVFLSEYGIGSAVDLIRATRHYEQLGAEHAMDARFYRAQLDRFLEDWKRGRLNEVFDRPEVFFAQSNARMAGQRLLGLNAIRSNPNVIGYSLTGTVDQGMTGEGLWTTFRELKPGTTDALFDGWAPLRWCLFAEPVHAYRGARVHLEAVLANEDVLRPSQYPVVLQVVGPDGRRVFERALTVTNPAPRAQPQQPSAPPDLKSQISNLKSSFVQAVFADDVTIDGPSGTYRFSATFQRGAAAAGESVQFFVTDPASNPRVDTEVVLWGEDTGLAEWLGKQKIRTRPFAPPAPDRREVILVSARPPAQGGAAAFRALAERMARGASAVFLSPAVFAEGNQSTRWVPLANKGRVEALPSWLYHKDEWCKRHPLFDGLPSGGLMDYDFYRELIPDAAWVGLDAPAEAVAGGINAAQGYSSGLMLSVHNLGAGRFILTTLRLRENLGLHPAADRLLINLLRYAARDIAKPPADLPPDFAAQLNAMGY